REGERGASLCAVLDRTCTPMGARMLRSRLSQPLLDVTAIEARLAAVAHLHTDGTLCGELRLLLKDMPDLQGLLTRAATRAAPPPDLVALRRGLAAAMEVRCRLGQETGPLPAIPDCADACALIGAAIADDAPATVDAGGAIRSGYHSELDELRALAQDART